MRAALPSRSAPLDPFVEKARAVLKRAPMVAGELVLGLGLQVLAENWREWCDLCVLPAHGLAV